MRGDAACTGPPSAPKSSGAPRGAAWGERGSRQPPLPALEQDCSDAALSGANCRLRGAVGVLAEDSAQSEEAGRVASHASISPPVPPAAALSAAAAAGEGRYPDDDVDEEEA